ncbi:MAG: hypothetical protein AAFY71_21305 [Bacteroidota bacterium]
MKNISDRKANQLWNTLNEREKKEFEEAWVANPSQKKIVGSWEKFSTPETLWEHCFPDSAFNDGNFRTWLSGITTSLEDYLSYLRFTVDPFHKQLYFIRRIKKETPVPLLTSYLEQTDRQFSQSPRCDADFLQLKHQFLKEKQEISVTRLNQRKSFSAEINSCRTEAEYVEYLSWALNVLNDSQIHKEKEEGCEIDLIKIRTIFSSPYLHSNPLLKAYSLLYKLLVGESIQPGQIEKILADHPDMAEDRITGDFYRLLFNYSIRTSIKDKGPGTLQSICAFVPKGIDHQYFSPQNHLPSIVYLSLMRAGCFVYSPHQLKKWKQAYLPQLHPDNAEFGEKFSELCIAYAGEEFEKISQEFPSKISSKIPRGFWTKYKIMLIESHFFAGDLDRAEKGIESLNRWLRRNTELPSSMRNVIFEKLTLVSMLLKTWRTPKESEFKEALRKSKLPFAHTLFFNQYMDRYSF